MASERGRNEGMRILAEFPCEAIPCGDASSTPHATKYIHEEVRMIDEPARKQAVTSLSEAEKSRIAQLDSWQLVKFVQSATNGWKFLVSLAVDRVDAKEPQFVSGAKELLQAATTQICRVA